MTDPRREILEAYEKFLEAANTQMAALMAEEFKMHNVRLDKIIRDRGDAVILAGRQRDRRLAGLDVKEKP